MFSFLYCPPYSFNNLLASLLLYTNISFMTTRSSNQTTYIKGERCMCWGEWRRRKPIHRKKRSLPPLAQSSVLHIEEGTQLLVYNTHTGIRVVTLFAKLNWNYISYTLKRQTFQFNESYCFKILHINYYTLINIILYQTNKFGWYIKMLKPNVFCTSTMK